jgi:hypothetical protein
MIGQIPTLNPSKAAVRALDNEIRNLPVKNKNTGTVSYPYKDFAGVTSQNIYNQLENGTKLSSAGNLRKAIVETMSKAKYRDMGFPKWEDTANAVIKPELRDIPAGMSGHSIFKADPTQGIIWFKWLYAWQLFGRHTGSGVRGHQSSAIGRNVSQAICTTKSAWTQRHSN